jgi:arylsulfatase A-like enzyme/Flp pilus assembly protein TadD
MARLRGTLAFLTIAAAAVIAAPGCRRTAAPADRILLITIDTLRADHLGYAGHDVETPNLDTLARDGAVFTQAVTAVPLTLPSHSTILSGFYPTRHQTRNNGTFRLPDEVVTVAETLREKGYATGAFIGAFVLDSRFGLAQGFDRYDDDLPEGNPLGSAFYAERRAQEVVERALKWISERDGERLFVWLHVYDPHAPYDPPSPYRERYSDRLYDGEIAYTDSTLGPLLEAFAPSRGGATLVTADHGESLGEHGESTHALFIYDGTMRVPLLLRANGISPGTRIAAQVRTVDIAPTILELAGLPSPGEPDKNDELDGKSLLPYVRGEEKASRSAYGESFNCFYNFNWAKLRSIRNGGYKLIDAPDRELYDLDSDPREEKNLWTDEQPPSVARNLVRELERIKASDRGVAANVDVDPETARRLESLGYVVASASARPNDTDDRALPDPKDRREVHERLQEILSRTDAPPDELISEYREILALEPENAWARSHLAHVLGDEKRYEEAVAEFRALIGTSALDARAYESLGIALLALDRVEEALDVTKTAVEARPWDPDVLILRGEALERASRHKEALAAYELAISLEPEDAENYWRCGAVLQKLGEIAEAEKQLRKAVGISPELEPAKLALARLLTQTGRGDEASLLLQSSAGGKPSPGVKAGLAEVELASNNFAGALRLLEEARAEAPENTRVLGLLGLIYAQKGELAKATATLEKALSLGEKDPEVRRNLALTYLQGGKTSSAIRELEIASRDAPYDPSIWFSLGNAYLRAGNFNGAAVSLEKCVELDPSREGALFNLALAYEHGGKRQRAAETYRRFLASGAKDEGRRAEAERRVARLGGSK